MTPTLCTTCYRDADGAFKYQSDCAFHGTMVVENANRAIAGKPLVVIDERRNPPPSHYGGSIEPWDYIAAHSLDFWQGNVVRYVTRAGRKADGEASALVDYGKARDYIDYLIRREETRNAESS